MEKYKTSHKYYRIWLFWVGIIATFAYRIIIILNNYSPLLVKIFWYIGTVGFVWYFAHRYRVENKRDKLIEENNLWQKVCDRNLGEKDCEIIKYVLKSVSSSKAKWNYVFIFFFSVLALIYGILTDFIL